MHGHSKGAGIFSSKWGKALKEKIDASKAKKAKKKDRGLGIKDKKADKKEAKSTKRAERHEAKHVKKATKAFKKGGWAGFGKVTGRHSKRHPVKKD